MLFVMIINYIQKYIFCILNYIFRLSLQKKNMTRLETLRNRREKLIELNNIHHFTQTNNCNIEKYYKLLLRIRREINDIECVNIRPLKARVGLSIFNLK